MDSNSGACPVCGGSGQRVSPYKTIRPGQVVECNGCYGTGELQPGRS